MPDPKKSTNVRFISTVFPRLVDHTPALSVWAAWQLFTHTPKRMKLGTPAQQLLRDADRWTFKAQGETLQAYTWGHGPTVALMHGWGSRVGQLAPFIEPLVEAGFRVAAFDGPGHGKSTGSKASVIHFADALRAFQHHTGPLHAIVAHSMGAASSVRALGMGLDVDRLVLIAPASKPKSYFSWFGDLVGLSPEQTCDLRAKLEAKVGVRFDDLDVAPQMSQRPTPVLVIHDTQDKQTDYTGGAEIAQLAPNGTLLTTEGLGHNRILNDANVIAAACAFVAAEQHVSRAPNWRALQQHELDAELAYGRP